MSQADHNTTNVEPLFHPVSHYDSPEDVLDDARLSTEEKRAILSSWASDMYVVESQPTLREVPGISHPLRLDDILAALKQLDDRPDPTPGGGLAMRLPRFSRIECAASAVPRRITHRQAPTRQRNHSRWTREANVRRYRRLLNTPLTDLERAFVKRRLAAELHECSGVPGCSDLPASSLDHRFGQTLHSLSSWPGRPKAESRRSTSRSELRMDVDGRDKHGHGGLGTIQNHLSLTGH